ncbi:hypothetical protein glysoja_048849 [Glycine soja]|uniref:Uncharacterized protein n=1 Tax=Glycine soja TaxID=3848 RepID=A0A0B2S2V7_GLYSO|nr:hypothetical protein glysoja_048849 [Glycine soja]
MFLMCMKVRYASADMENHSQSKRLPDGSKRIRVPHLLMRKSSLNLKKNGEGSRDSFVMCFWMLPHFFY